MNFSSLFILLIQHLTNLKSSVDNQNNHKSHPNLDKRRSRAKQSKAKQERLGKYKRKKQSKAK